jgi:hypothetical protein
MHLLLRLALSRTGRSPPVVGKLLLKSNCVTLLPLLLKETSHFIRYPFIPVTVPLQLLVTAFLKVMLSLLVTTKSN